MMPSAQWDRELVAHLTPECARLYKPEVMGVRWLSSANQARSLGHRFYVVAIANSTWLGDGQHALVHQF
jgi:hypothetical protein